MTAEETAGEFQEPTPWPWWRYVNRLLLVGVLVSGANWLDDILEFPDEAWRSSTSNFLDYITQHPLVFLASSLDNMILFLAVLAFWPLARRARATVSLQRYATMCGIFLALGAAVAVILAASLGADYAKDAWYYGGLGEAITMFVAGLGGLVHVLLAWLKERRSP